jgi:hypothetical protein
MNKKIGRNRPGFSQLLFFRIEKPKKGLSYFFLRVLLLATDFLADFRAVAFLPAGFLPLFFVPTALFVRLFVVFLLTGIHTPPFLAAMAVHVKFM